MLWEFCFVNSEIITLGGTCSFVEFKMGPLLGYWDNWGPQSNQGLGEGEEWPPDSTKDQILTHFGSIIKIGWLKWAFITMFLSFQSTVDVWLASTVGINQCFLSDFQHKIYKHYMFGLWDFFLILFTLSSFLFPHSTSHLFFFISSLPTYPSYPPSPPFSPPLSLFHLQVIRQRSRRKC